MRITFEVTIELTKVHGPYIEKEILAEEFVSQLEDECPSNLFVDESEYEITSCTVKEKA